MAHVSDRYAPPAEAQPKALFTPLRAAGAASVVGLGVAVTVAGPSLPGTITEFDLATIQSSAQAACTATGRNAPEEAEVTFRSRGGNLADKITLPCAKINQPNYIARAAYIGKKYCDESYKTSETRTVLGEGLRAACGTVER